MSPSVPPGDDDGATFWTESGVGAAAAPLAGRYRLLGLLGQGGGGEVYRAVDELMGREVAVKRFRVSGRGGRARIRREVAALRLLDLPGVVVILDDGEAEGSPFVVMELVEGSPFPGEGRKGEWESVRAPTLSLLSTLARVHDAGVVHRDIKPGNVLVDAEGSAVLLDFGLARGQTVGVTVTSQGMVLGTPRYLAPEQLVGETITPATDLYAVGAMLYEALSGRPPFEHEDVDALWRAKLLGAPVPLARLVPSLPRAVTDVVMAMLTRRADERPASADAVLTALGGDGTRHQLPWVGPTAPLDAALAAAAEGRLLRIGGPPGSGRTRLLQDLAERLAAQGRPVQWTLPGGSPFESLSGLVDDFAALAQAGDVGQALRGRLADFLADRRGVLLVDDVDALDRWSRGLVLAAAGTVVVATPPDRADIVLSPLLEADLRGLFRGPDVFLHLREDAAHELFARTAGNPSEVAAELRAWVRGGLARWNEGRLEMERAALDRLRSGARVRALSAGIGSQQIDPELSDLLAWLQLAGVHADAALLAEVTQRPRWQVDLELEELVRLDVVERPPDGPLRCLADRDLAAAWPSSFRRDAHGAIAAALPLGAEGRLFHLLAAGDSDDVAAEAVALARRQRGAGRVGQAEAALIEALRAIRRDDAEGEAPLLAALVRTAVAAGSEGPIERARYEVQRSEHPDPRLLAVLEAARDTRRGRIDQAMAALDQLPTFPETDLELARHATRLQAAQRGDPARHAEVLKALRTWSAETGDSEVAARLPGWEGLLAFREGRYADAARLHEKSAGLRTERLGRTSALMNAAMAWLEACELDRAVEMAQEARQEAVEARAPVYEARATWVVRSVAARRADPVPPDTTLVHAAEALGHAELAGTVAFTEGILAWRAGQAALAARLAVLASGHFETARIAPAILMATVLRLAADPDADLDAEALADEASACSLPVVGVEALGMLAAVGRLGSDRVAAIEALLEHIPAASWSVARGMIAPAEALERVREAAALA